VVESAPASGVVTGDSGARLPLPRPSTAVLSPCTTPLVELTTEPRPATVAPTGFGVAPIWPTPLVTALASEFSVALVPDTALPRPCVTCGLRPGIVCAAINAPRSLVVLAAPVTAPEVPVVVVVVPPPPVDPEPPPVPVLAVGGELTVLPPHAASRPATATAINGVRSDRKALAAGRRLNRRCVDMCAPQCLFWRSCLLLERAVCVVGGGAWCLRPGSKPCSKLHSKPCVEPGWKRAQSRI